MKLIHVFSVVISLLFLGRASNHAQGVVYANLTAKAGSTSNIPVLSLVMDRLTNGYVLGVFTNTTTLNKTVLTNTGGWTNIFLAKFVSLGAGMMYVRAPVSDAAILNAKVGSDFSASAYLAGTFTGTNVAFGTNSVANYASDYSSDIFLAKFDSLGNSKWVHKLGGTANEVLGDMVTDTNGESFLTGRFQSPTFTAGVSNLVLQGANGGDCFTVKLDASGNVLWLEQGSNARGTCLALDARTNCYVGGYVIGPAMFDGSSPANPVTTNFLAKYNYGGGLAWVRGDFTLGKFIAVDAAQNLYTAGTFSNQLQFGPLTLENASPATVFVAKYDLNGNPLWARQVPGLGNDDVTGLLIDSFTNCWISGYVESPTAPANPVAMVAQLDQNGGLADISQVGSPLSSAGGIGTMTYSKGSWVFVAGNYATNFTLGYHPVTNTGALDIFYSWVLTPPAISTPTKGTNLVCSWPNTDSNLVLQSSSDLSTWSAVTNAVSTANGQNTVTNSATSRAAFFRLYRP